MENKVKAKLHTIYINCSDVAAAIGMNRYKSSKQIARNILIQQFNNVSDNTIGGVVGEEEANEYEIIDKTKDILSTNHRDKIIELAQQKMSSVSHETKQKLERESEILTEEITEAVIEESIKLSINDVKNNELEIKSRKIKAPKIEKITQTIVKEVVNHSISMKTGVIAEKAIVDAVEKSVDKKVEDRNCTIKYRNIYLPSSLCKENHKWRIVIGGKPDGIIHGDKIQIVEVKNRQKRLFYSIPEYEYVQVQLYLWIFNAQQCQFREQYHNEHWDSIIEFDPKMITKIEKKLINFAKEYILTSVNV
jgi:hypothetical protein